MRQAQRYVQGKRVQVTRYKVESDKRYRTQKIVEPESPIECFEYECPFPNSCSTGPTHRVVADPDTKIRIDTRHLGRTVAVGVWATEHEAFRELEVMATRQAAPRA